MPPMTTCYFTPMRMTILSPANHLYFLLNLMMRIVLMSGEKSWHRREIFRMVGPGGVFKNYSLLKIWNVKDLAPSARHKSACAGKVGFEVICIMLNTLTHTSNSLKNLRCKSVRLTWKTRTSGDVGTLRLLKIYHWSKLYSIGANWSGFFYTLALRSVKLLPVDMLGY